MRGGVFQLMLIERNGASGARNICVPLWDGQFIEVGEHEAAAFEIAFPSSNKYY